MRNNLKEVKVFDKKDLEKKRKELLKKAEDATGKRGAFDVELTETSITTTEIKTGRKMKISILE